ncbi:hypothetical protein GBA65_01825 [Rubrobacter marinus]|uniref:SseB protein N-terminal domain-containing protein n=1 Tax=Rubrobacter marinus TaxID=2653852 RepID=A0A6G8PSN9_9ACTN|nr:hypothetical protein [Rubrobacter marinus]QIN77450.1 hypothetical protein GBA65_01825 [Rubrobacter marinus]
MLTERIEGAGRIAGLPLWLISRETGGRRGLPPEPLLVDGGEALAVFGHEEEAEMFLGFWAPRDGWRAREVGAEALASLLRGPSWPGVRRVALDPLPGGLGGAALDPLVGMDRDRFAERLAPSG